MPIAKALITKFVVERKRGGKPLTSTSFFVVLFGSGKKKGNKEWSI